MRALYFTLALITLRFWSIGTATKITNVPQSLVDPSHPVSWDPTRLSLKYLASAHTPPDRVETVADPPDASHSSLLPLPPAQPSFRSTLLQQSDRTPETSEHLDSSLGSMQHASNKNEASPNDKNNEIFLGRITTLARLYNAISLQSGLMNGSITVDTAIGQLLSIGSVKTADILAFNQESIVKLIDKMVVARESIGVGAVKMLKEDIVLANDLIQSFPHMGDLTQVPSIDAYSERIKGFLKAVKGEALKSSLESLDFAKDELSRIKDLNSDSDDVTKHATLTALNTFKSRIQSFKLSLDTLNKEIPEWKSYSDLGDFDSFKILKPLEHLLRFYLLQDRLIDTVNREDISIIKRELSEISKLVEDSKLASSSFTLMNDLIKWKMASKHEGDFNGVAGLKLVTDGIQKDWFGSALSHIGKAHQIVNGLKPILTLNSKLELLNSKFDRITDSELRKSFQAFQTIHNSIGKLTPGYENSTGFVAHYRDCFAPGPLSYDDLLYLIRTVYSVYSGFGAIRRSKFLERDMSKISDELERFWSSVSSTDTVTSNEVVEVYNKLKENGSLTKVKMFLEEILKNLNVKLYGPAKTISEAESAEVRLNNLPAFWNKDDFKNVSQRVSCLTAWKSEAEQASNAISIILNLKKIDSAMVDSVKVGLDLVSQLSNGIKDLKVESLIENMKQGVTDETERLNRISPYSPPSLDTATNAGIIITEAASMFQDSLEFVKLKSSLDQLDVDIRVNESLAKNPVVMKSIEDQWENPEKYVAQLRKDMEEVEKFHSSINSADNLKFSDYGTPFNTINLNDIAENAGRKSTAIERSLPYVTDPKSQNELATAKKVLDRMDAMNLAFAMHRKKLRETQGVLQHLDKFLEQFLEEYTVSESAEKANSDILWIIIVCVLAALILGAGGTTAFMWYKKKGCFKVKGEKSKKDQQHQRSGSTTISSA